jgi:aminoglycoside phosphotransferase (APT) family kinase protein
MSPESRESVVEVPELGPVPRRLSLDVDTVRALVADQFPRWADLPVSPVPTPGWDNFTFRLADDMLVRLPSAAEYALAVEKEHRWLPELAEQLPVPTPEPLAQGMPGAGYPFRWSVYRWLRGEPAAPSTLTDPMGFAEDVTDFLLAMRGIDPTGGPQPGVHNWFRGGTLRTFDATARDALTRLDGQVDVALAAAAWGDSLEARWDGVDRWFHGDLAAGNLLLDRGRLAAVIDFGTCGVGDPSCDLAVAWTVLDLPGRRLLRDRLGIDAPTWARGRGWALWKTLSNLANDLEDEDEHSAGQSRRVVDAILDDFSTST